jgi:hypothetical protein
MDLSGLPDDTLSPGLDLGGLPDTNAKALREQYRTTTSTPDDAAKVIDLTKRTGLPKPVVERNRQAVERQAFEPDWNDLETSAPITVRELAANTKLFELANDDTENLREIERTMNRRSAGLIGGPAFDRSQGTVQASVGPEASFSTIVAGQMGVLPNTFERIRQGVRLEIADLLGFETVQQDAQRRRQQVDHAEALQTPEFDSTLGRWVYGGASNVQRVVPSIAAGIATRSPAVGLAAMGAQVQPESYGKYRARGGTPGEAALGSGVETAIEIGTEMLPMGFVVEKFGKAGATQFLAGYLGRELPTELAAEIAQGAVDTAIANPDKTWGDYVKELPDTVGQTVVSTLMMSGGLTVANEAARRLAGPQAQADIAARDAEALAQLSQLAAASKLRARDPQTFQDFVQTANEDGAVQDIYLDARTLQQAGIDPALLAQVSPAVAAQLEQALATGGDLVIPMAEYAARIAGTELDPVLTPHLRTSEDALSLDEAQRFYQGQAEEFQKAAAQVMEERASDDAWTASATAVQVKLFDELSNAGRFTDDVNRAYATLMRDFYVANASRMGLTPEEMFARYPLRVAAERMAGDARRMDQAPEQPANPLTKLFQAVTDALGITQPAPPAVSPAPTFPAGPVLDMGQFFRGSQDRAVTLGALAGEGNKQAVLAQALMDGGWLSAQDFADVFEGQALGAEFDRLGSIPPLKTVLTQMRRAVLDDPKVLDAVVAAAPVGMVDNLFGSQSAAKVALHDEAMLQDSLAFNADLPVAETPETARSVGLLAREVALVTAKTVRSVADARGEAAEGSAAMSTSEGDSFSQGGPRNRAEIAFGRDITSTPTVITLFNTADLSSFLHEMGHFQLEVLANIASQPNAPAEMVQDMARVLAWFGVADLAAWQAMSLEEKRPYHEQFARGFESYLFEGKAPTPDLQALFSRFRSWLISVYKSVKALNVEISDDIRGVFDRLVATDEAIKQAESARAYGALFKSAEEVGATPEEWAEYQRTGAEATQTAVDGLQRRSLRDMRWLTNARGRILKQLQADAKVKREEVRKEVAREVWATPTYQAWQFLTSRENLEDVAATPKDVRPDGVDPANDNLMTAVAKLGGLRKDQLVGEWGMDPKERPWSGVFGKPIVRAEGKGRTLDEMGLALVDYGYLVADENGLYDAREFEEKFFDGLRGTPHYSNQADYDALLNGPAQPTTDDLRLRNGGRLDTASVRAIVGLEMAAKIEARRMARTGALEPDVVAEMVGFTSGDEMLRTLADAAHPHEMIEGMTDQRVLERYGDLANPDTLARAADEAIHNEARARFVATELKALSKAMTPVRAITKAARDFAAATIARKKVRDIKPNQHAKAETRAAKAAEKAMSAGDTVTAVVEKRNQLVQNYGTRLSYEALDEIDKAVKYLRKFDSEGTRKGLDTEYVDQIDQLLERFDLRASVTNKTADKRAKLAAWLEAQRDQGFEPDIPADIIDSAMRKPYRELTLEELRGLVDTVKQIEHLGRLKQKLLTAKDEREFKAIRDEIAASIEANAKGTRDLRTRETTGAMLAEAGNRFLAMHRKMASVAREMDGFADGGPMWEYFIRSMNEAGDRETTRRAEATARLYALVKPLVAQGKMGGKGQYFETLGGSYNREERIAIALNLGNAGNMQRMLDGEGWTPARLQPLLATITPEEADFVQAVWDFFESYRPEIAAKERRIYGKEPNWVEPQPVTLGGKTLRGGYYPIKYDTARSGRAEAFADAESAKAQMRGAYTTATTRRSFTKARAEEVTGRPLLYSFAGLYQGTNEVIHDLSWHEWLVDVNRLLRSLDGPIRTHYGAETVGIFKKAIEDIAAGDVPAQNVFERGLNHTRTGATIAGLGWNLMTSLLQPVGLTQSMVRIGPGWVAKGMSQWIKAPLDTLTEINSKSAMMTSRAQTMQREINEIQNQVRGSKLDPVRGTFFTLIQKMQMVADVPTWLGAYEKHVAAGEAEARAVALADQAVLDAQGGGQMKDLSQIQRGHPALKLFTNFYSFFNVAYNLGVEKTKQKITQPKLYPSLALDYLLLYMLPAAFVTVMKEAIVGGGDDDEEKLVKKIIADQISYLLGTIVGLREVTAGVQKALGVEQFKGSYGGPAGLRLFQEIDKLGQQIGQGEADMAAFKAANNVGGIIFHYPSGQINRSVEGVAAMVEGKTANPLAVVVGPPKP